MKKYMNNNMIIIFKDVIIPVIVILLLEMFFFRNLFMSDFNGLIGDSGDARLNNLILEHWYHVFFYGAPIKEYPIFYPITNTLGYTDTLMFFSIPYSIFRMIGFDWLRANQITLISVHLFGSLCLFYFLRKKLNLDSFTSVIGLVISFFGSSYYNKTAHTQLFALSMVPLLCIMLYGYFYNCLLNKKKRIIYGIGFIIYFSLILLTSFYIGFFTGFFIIVLSVVFYILQRVKRISIFKILKDYAWNNKLEFVIYVIVGAISLIPFLWIYIPVMKQQGVRSWGDISWMLPRWYDYFNVSSSNIIWGKLFKNEIFSNRPYAGELLTGVPIITMILFFILLLYCGKKVKKFYKVNCQSSIKEEYESSTIFSMAISIIIIFILILKIGNNLSLWWFVFKIVPGASAMRAVSRFNMFLALPMAIVISYCLYHKLQSLNMKKVNGILLCIILGIILMVENTNVSSITRWSKSDIDTRIDKVSAPPSDCKIFFIMDKLQNSNKISNIDYQLDAWMIANRYNLVTVNGYSGQFPKQWKLFEVNNDVYFNYVVEWLHVNNIDNINDVYGYDLTSNTWTKIEHYIKYEQGTTINFGQGNTVRYSMEGWSTPENGYTWTDGDKATLLIYMDKTMENLNLKVNCFPLVSNKLTKQRVKIDINGVHIGEWEVNKEDQYNVAIPKELVQKRNQIQFELLDATSPAELKISNDQRKLGIAVKNICIVENN